MALRIRKNGVIVCAAKSGPKQGDIYIDDRKHSELVESNKIRPINAKVWVATIPLIKG